MDLSTISWELIGETCLRDGSCVFYNYIADLKGGHLVKDISLFYKDGEEIDRKVSVVFVKNGVKLKKG